MIKAIGHAAQEATAPLKPLEFDRNEHGAHEVQIDSLYCGNSDPRLMWTDLMSIATDGYLYITANQLHRQAKYQQGKDLRQKPYMLFRVRLDAQPVLLR